MSNMELAHLDSETSHYYYITQSFFKRRTNSIFFLIVHAVLKFLKTILNCISLERNTKILLI